MRIFRFLLLILPLQTGMTFAQSDTLAKTSILLIPYQPEFYLSDADRDILEASRRDPAYLHEYFRSSLDIKLSAELETMGTCIRLLKDTGIAGRIQLAKYYDGTAFYYAEPVGKRVSKESEMPRIKKKGILPVNQHTAPQSITTRGDRQYMRAEIKDTVTFRRMLSKYKADMMVSINQFEIKTNYNTCLDIANKIYRREVLVHYSVFNSRGKEVLGNYAVAYFPSDSNRDSEIAERCFPEIAREIFGNLKNLPVDTRP